MSAKELIADGIGDVPAWLADEGLKLAVTYFEDMKLNPKTCFDAKKRARNDELADHWDKAEELANKVLLGDSRYENSMINLDYDYY
jgi:hypothetical protein